MAITGCSRASDADWQRRYSDAQSKFRFGYTKEAHYLADAGYQASLKTDQIWNWRFRILKAQISLRQNAPEQAINLLASEPPPNSAPDVSVRRRTFQGYAFCRLNKPAEAEAALAQADSLAKSSEPSLGAEIAYARGVCTMPRAPDDSQRYFAQAAQLAHGRDAFIEANALNNIGYLHLRSAQYDAAIQEFNRGVNLTDSYLVREKVLGNLADSYAELGDWKQSISLAEQAEKLASKIENISDQEKWLLDLGRAHSVIHEYSAAELYYSRALPIAKTLNDTDAVSRCLNDLIELALQRRDPSTAESYWKEESALSLGPDRKVYVSFDAAGIAMERKELAKAESLLETILKSKTNDSLRLRTERELGIVYWQENQTGKADLAFRDAIKDVEDTIAKIPPQYQMSFLDQDPFYDSYVRFLVAEGRILEALKIAERGRAQILSQATRYGQRRRPAFSLETVQAALKRRNQRALAYSLTNEESFVWVITPTQLKVRRLASHEVLGLQVDAYNKEITGPHRSIEDSSAGQELYKALVQPAESLIPKRCRVVIIPSKILSVLSFESLIVPGRKPYYWIDDVEIETAGSLALLAQPRAAATTAARSKKDLLLLGAPVEADKAFPFLPNASDEMNRVRSHFPANQETIISGKDAVPQAYRSSNPGEYRFIHIDAHSAASELNPLDSFVVLSPSGNSYKLFAHDITNTPLHADLVTLSACYGAGTRWYQGEGIVGLGWAFLRAGAHQVVASLWTVDDASTPQLMDDFYGELSKGKSAAEALRTAKLKMLHSGGQNSRPFYWASLQLYTGS